MTSIEFRAWPKTPRLFRDMIITEKIDGTNAAIGIVELTEAEWIEGPSVPAIFRSVGVVDIAAVPGERHFGVYAQSRNRLIMPGKSTDNAGFAGWVFDNAGTLVHDLGPGLHFGEWWGNGIQRGYGLAKDDKRFSLFNVSRYGDRPLITPNLATVPVLHTFTMNTEVIREALGSLKITGSYAAPGYMNPEGIVVFHTASGQVFKVTVENDETPKSLAQ